MFLEQELEVVDSEYRFTDNHDIEMLNVCVSYYNRNIPILIREKDLFSVAALIKRIDMVWRAYCYSHDYYDKVSLFTDKFIKERVFLISALRPFFDQGVIYSIYKL